MTATKSEKQSRLLRLREVKQIVALQHSEIYKRMNEGRFPQSVHLGPKAVRWLEDEVMEWVNGFAQQRT